ncbi:unnamed protein product [Closterium sp. NIES-64]|nr:unnamed protein product [Closterium sp. NIES-64]
MMRLKTENEKGESGLRKKEAAAIEGTIGVRMGRGEKAAGWKTRASARERGVGMGGGNENDIDAATGGRGEVDGASDGEGKRGRRAGESEVDGRRKRGRRAAGRRGRRARRGRGAHGALHNKCFKFQPSEKPVLPECGRIQEGFFQEAAHSWVNLPLVAKAQRASWGTTGIAATSCSSIDVPNTSTRRGTRGPAYAAENVFKFYAL